VKIRAAVLEEFAAPLAVQELDLAEPGPGEALVRLDEVNKGFELMEAQDGIRSVMGFA
jgi:Zn-dependent alcohol dehydrogenase